MWEQLLGWTAASLASTREANVWDFRACCRDKCWKYCKKFCFEAWIWDSLSVLPCSFVCTYKIMYSCTFICRIPFSYIRHSNISSWKLICTFTAPARNKIFDFPSLLNQGYEDRLHPRLTFLMEGTTSWESHGNEYWQAAHRGGHHYMSEFLFRSCHIFFLWYDLKTLRYL